MNLLSRLRNFFRMKDTRNNLWVILIAAVLFQVVLVAQHIYTHRLLDNELDHSAESGLRLKAILTKGDAPIHPRHVHTEELLVESRCNHDNHKGRRNFCVP